MYTITEMPKTKNLRGPYKNFLLKLYADDVKRWGEVYWTAHKRATERRMKLTDQAVNEALLNLPGALPWLVTKEERLYFYGRSKIRPTSLVELTPEEIANLYTYSNGENPPAERVQRLKERRADVQESLQEQPRQPTPIQFPLTGQDSEPSAPPERVREELDESDLDSPHTRRRARPKRH